MYKEFVDSKEFVWIIVRCLIKLRAVKEFVRIIVRCLIKLRAVKEFVRIIVRCLIELRAIRILLWELYSVLLN